MLEAIVHRLPPPGDRDAPLKALLVDSWYDAYLGVVVLLRVVDGSLRRGQRILMSTDASCEVDKIELFTPKCVTPRSSVPVRSALPHQSKGRGCAVGDTITGTKRPTAAAPRLPAAIPSCCGPFPVCPPTSRRCAPQAAAPQRASFTYEMETSARWGSATAFLISCILRSSRRRLEREFNLNLIATAHQ